MIFNLIFIFNKNIFYNLFKKIILKYEYNWDHASATAGFIEVYSSMGWQIGAS